MERQLGAVQDCLAQFIGGQLAMSITHEAGESNVADELSRMVNRHLPLPDFGRLVELERRSAAPVLQQEVLLQEGGQKADLIVAQDDTEEDSSLEGVGESDKFSKVVRPAVETEDDTMDPLKSLAEAHIRLGHTQKFAVMRAEIPISLMPNRHVMYAQA